MKMGNLELDPLSSPLDGFFAPLQLKRIHRHHVPAVRSLFESCPSLTRASTSEHRRGRAYQRLYSPLHLVPTTCGPSACRTQALSCPLPVCSTASPGPLPAPDQPLGAAYSAGLSLSPYALLDARLRSLQFPPIVLHPLPSPGYRRRFFARVSTIYISSSPPRECIKIARVNTLFRGGFFRLYLLLQRGLLSTEINNTQDDQGRDAVTGVRLDTGETVTVVLRPYQGPLKAPRAEVKDFATLEGEISKVIQSVSSDEMRKQVLKGMRAKTEPGGVILVQRAYTERDTGIVSAGWLQSAAKYADHCTVVGNVMLRMDPVRYREQAGESHAYASANALATDKSQRIKSAAPLSAALMEAFSGGNESLGGPTAGRPIALIRLSDGNTQRAIEMALPGGKDPETNEYTLSTPSSAAAAFLSSPNGKQAAQLAGDPEIGVEVIPGSRFSLGPQAKLSLENSAGGLERINRAYRFKKDVPDETGFTPSYIVLHAVPGGHVFSTAEPLS